MKSKSVPIYYMGKQINKPRILRTSVGRFTSFKVQLVNGVRYSLRIIAFLAALSFAAFIGYAMKGNEVTATNYIVQDKSIAPVMQRIAKAESGNHHLAANGQVIIHVNKNGTVDLGVMQINSVWFSAASKLGYDLTKEEDNRAFAQYLYENYGTEPWNSSAANW